VFRQEDNDFFLANENTATKSTRQRETFVEADVLFQEFRFASTLGGAWEYLVGVDFYSLESSELIDDFSGGGQTIPTSAIRLWEVEQDSWAAYGAVDYHFADLPLSISAELRYARDDVKGHVNTVLPRLNNRVILDSGGTNDYSNLPWGVSLAWRFENVSGPVSEAMAFFKVGSSYRHGGINLGAGLPSDAYPVPVIYDEEDSISYEIGVKSGWFDGVLKLNASTFFVVYQDFLNTTTNGCPQECPYLDPHTIESLGYDANGERITVTASGEAGIESNEAFFIDNTGEIEAWGVEVESSFNLPVGESGGRLLGNLGWARQMGEVTEISSSVSPANADLKGARLNFIRPVQLKGSFTWHQPLSFQGMMLKATVSYIHESGGVRSLGNNNPIDGVDRMDARIGVESAHWSFTLNGNNVLDKEYFTDETVTRFRLAEPRYFYFELSWNYR
jgi:outer membrane receptor protein involved in Fe transport